MQLSKDVKFSVSNTQKTWEISYIHVCVCVCIYRYLDITNNPLKSKQPGEEGYRTPKELERAVLMTQFQEDKASSIF